MTNGYVSLRSYYKGNKDVCGGKVGQESARVRDDNRGTYEYTMDILPFVKVNRKS